jgi:corin
MKRQQPPTPPLRKKRVFLDSGKLLQNSQILGTFNSAANNETANNGNVNINSAMINKENYHRRPPPLTHHMNQRQDSSISSDSFSLMSSPGYNSKNMEVPLLQSSSKMNKQRMIHQNSIMKSMRTKQNTDSDSFSQTSSPGYNSKMIDAPLLANAQLKLHVKGPEEVVKNNDDIGPTIRQSASTPAIQTFVRFSNGSSSIQHKIMRARKNSNPYITRGRLKFRLCQILCNALALFAIAAGLVAYFKAYPTLKFVNQTVISSLPETSVTRIEENPAPGICLPIIVKFCQIHKLPYNYTVFPNYIGHFGQLEAQVELDNFDALVGRLPKILYYNLYAF